MKEHQNLQISGANKRPVLIDIRYNANRTPKPLVIFVHGFKGFKDWGHFNPIADAFAEQQFVFLKFNFSHNGTTPEHPQEFVDLEAFGQNNFSFELEDLGNVIDFANSRKFPVPKKEFDANHIYLLGHSRGGGIAILKAVEDSRVKKIATWASVSEYGKYWNDAMLPMWQENGVVYVPNVRTGQQMPLFWQLYEDFRDNRNRLIIPDAVKKLRIPFLVVHGTADLTVPYQSALDLVDWHPAAKLVTVLGGDHTFGGKHPFSDPELPESTQKAVMETVGFFKENG